LLVDRYPTHDNEAGALRLPLSTVGKKGRLLSLVIRVPPEQPCDDGA
jgi:hypothetical protein